VNLDSYPICLSEIMVYRGRLFRFEYATSSAGPHGSGQTIE
jgi:hypothetical protein